MKSLDSEDSRMDTGELGPLSPVTPMKVKLWNSLTKYTDTSKATSIMRSSSQLPDMSTASSSQSEIGFFSQATRLVTNMLGGGKKAMPEVKSLQLAATAANKVCFFDKVKVCSEQDHNLDAGQTTMGLWQSLMTILQQ